MAIPSNRARHRPAYDTSIDSGARAKAIRDWADDGNYDTRLEWDKNIRLTYVTDALGHETAITTTSPAYLLRRASGRARNGLFRDDAKNVVGDADCDQVLASLQKKFGCH